MHVSLRKVRRLIALEAAVFSAINRFSLYTCVCGFTDPGMKEIMFKQCDGMPHGHKLLCA